MQGSNTAREERSERLLTINTHSQIPRQNNSQPLQTARNYISSSINYHLSKQHTDSKHNIKVAYTKTAKEEVKTPYYYITLFVVYLRYNVFN